MSSMVFRFATAQGPCTEWFLRRNCSATPSQLGCFYAFLCLVSLGIGMVFWVHGAKLIVLFAWAEMVLVGVAFLVYSRHATDRERILLDGSSLVVELERGGHLERREFNRAWVRVEPVGGDDSLISVSAHGQAVEVGRYVRPELRSELAREIRMALRSA